MPSLTLAGVSPDELAELVEGERWSRWRRVEQGFHGIETLDEFHALRGTAEDGPLGALLRLAAHDGGDDQLAAVVVVHHFREFVLALSRRYWNVAGAEAEGVVVGALWEQIRAFPWRRRSRCYAASLRYGTQHAVVAALMPGWNRHGGDPLVPLDPQTWVFETLLGGAEVPEAPPPDPEAELACFLGWAVHVGVVSEVDVNLLTELVAVDRDTTAGSVRSHGACSLAAVDHVAGRRGVCGKTVIRARDRVLARLRAAAPRYLEEVA